MRELVEQFGLFPVIVSVLVTTPLGRSAVMLAVAICVAWNLRGPSGQPLLNRRALAWTFPAFLVAWTLFASAGWAFLPPSRDDWVTRTYFLGARYFAPVFGATALLLALRHGAARRIRLDSAGLVPIVLALLPPSLRAGAEGLLRDFADERDSDRERGWPTWCSNLKGAWYLLVYVARAAISVAFGAWLGRFFGS